MAKYSTKQTVHEQDVLSLNKDEYTIFNKIYKQALREKILAGKEGDTSHTISNLVDSVDLKYVILTDGTYRVEFIVEQA